MNLPILTILAVLPLIGSLIVFGLPKGQAGKATGLIVSVVTAIIAAMAVFTVDSSQIEPVQWIPQLGVYYALSLDGMGKAMVILTAVLTPVALLAEWEYDRRPSCSQALASRWSGHVFTALVLMLEGFALFVFMAADVMIFYLFFEATLIPMFFLIFGWGGHDRARAALKFLVFSLAGGLVMLFSVIGIYVMTAQMGHPTYLIRDLASIPLNGAGATGIFAGLLFAFAV